MSFLVGNIRTKRIVFRNKKDLLLNSGNLFWFVLKVTKVRVIINLKKLVFLESGV